MGFWSEADWLFLPDIGTYFNQDMGQAHALVDGLAEAGCRWLKGEILHDPSVALELDFPERYWDRSSGRFVEENYRRLIERKVVPLEAYAELFDHVRERGMRLCLSVYDFEGLEFALSQNVDILKIASSNITHQPLIELIARTNRPVIIDTGHSTLEEIARAINWVEDANEAADVLIEHSPPGPPAPVAQHNLRFMQTLASAFDRPVGLSDHHESALMLPVALAMGAKVVEKGVCPDDDRVDQDVAHALPLSQVADVLRKLKAVYDALGSGQRHLPREREKYRSRMGVVAARLLQAGECITLDDVYFAFPVVEGGIGTEFWSLIEGSRLRQSVDADVPLRWEWLDVRPSD